MPGCWLIARAEEHRLAAVELIRKKGGGGGNWQTREVGRAKRLMPRAAPWVWVGDGQSWLLGSRLSPGVSAPARSAEAPLLAFIRCLLQQETKPTSQGF